MNITLTIPELEHYLVFFFIGYCLNQLLKRMQRVAKHVLRQLKNERRKLMRQHFRARHPHPLKRCLHPDCQPLRHL